MDDRLFPSAENLQPDTVYVNSESHDSDSGNFLLMQDVIPGKLEANSSYRIESELGRGGVGVVYRARDLTLNRDVAIKVLLREHVGNERTTQHFVDEALIMGSLQHPGIAHVYECGHTVDERPFHTMKLVEGKTMYALFREKTNPEQKTSRLLNIFSKVANAIAYSHSRSIVHLDLKPSNVMVGQFGEVHVMDWGLARDLDRPDTDPAKQNLRQGHSFSKNGRGKVKAKYPWNAQQRGDANRVHGTLQYMAPEQARSEEVDQRTDVFCLGAILCEILIGRAPYKGKNRMDVYHQAKRAELSGIRRELDESNCDLNLIRLAKRCLREDADLRPNDASEIANEMASHSESALKQIKNDMTKFFELSLDLFCIAGFDGFFRRINSNFSKVLGFTEQELLGQPFLDFVIPEDQTKTINVMGKLLEGQHVVRFRNRYRTNEGQIITFEWTAKSILDEQVIYAVARNVSDDEEN